MSLIRNILHRQDGQTMIEVAMILPVMILMMLAVLDFAVILNQDLRVADSARSAAESATVRIYATNNALAQLVGTSSTGGIPNYNIVAINYCTCANGSGITSCADHASCGTYGIPNQYVKVTATATLPLLFGIRGFPASINVKSVAIARTAWTGTN